MSSAEQMDARLAPGVTLSAAGGSCGVTVRWALRAQHRLEDPAPLTAADSEAG